MLEFQHFWSLIEWIWEFVNESFMLLLKFMVVPDIFWKIYASTELMYKTLPHRNTHRPDWVHPQYEKNGVHLPTVEQKSCWNSVRRTLKHLYSELRREEGHWGSRLLGALKFPKSSVSHLFGPAPFLKCQLQEMGLRKRKVSWMKSSQWRES